MKTRFICTIGPKTVDRESHSGGYHGTFAFNPWYKTTNMATGLWLTKKSESNLVILYSEIIFDPTILDDLLAADGDVVLVVDRRTTLDAEDEKVVLAEDRVVRASRDLPLDEAHGEFIGLAKVTRAGARHLWEEIDGLIRTHHMMAYLTEAFERLSARGVPIGAVFTAGRAWGDNDNLADLQTSRERVYPRIRDARAARLDREKAVR